MKLSSHGKPLETSQNNKNSNRSSSNGVIDLIVIGGGASGFMAAITAAERGIRSVSILESTSKVLEKVFSP